MLLSGLFLLFHLRSHMVENIHWVASIVFITACAPHIALNRRSLLKVFAGPLTVWPLLAVILLAFLIMVFSDIGSGHKRHDGQRHRISRSF